MTKERNSKQDKLINPVLPPGVKDILAVEAKELKSIKKRLAKVYESWGYEEVFTPAFEYFDVLSLQAGERIKKEMFKFFDDRGDLLALRPDMTISIARLVSQKVSEESLPLRLYYQSNVFRQQKPLQGQPREFWQSGVELIGGKQTAVDAELIMMLIETLKALNLDNFKIGLGSVGFVKALLSAFNKDGSKLKTYLAQKNLVAVNKMLASNRSAAAKNLKKVLSLRGDKALLQAKKLSLNKKASQELASLNKVANLLKKMGYDKYITYDFSLVPDFEYYTGLVFEVYVEGVGLEVASGGRYDNLLSNLGRPFNAAGFAIGLERLHMAIVNQGQVLAERKTKIILSGSLSDELYNLATDARKQNKIVKIFAGSIRNPKKLLTEKKAKWFVKLGKDKAEIISVKDRKTISKAQLRRWLKNA